MKVDATLQGQVGDWDAARDAEERGYDTVWLSEISTTRAGCAGRLIITHEHRLA